LLSLRSLSGFAFRQKIRPFHGVERPVLAKSSGEEGKTRLH